ncbi:hypothetical protein QOZ83_01855 [Romboutsia sedimentorum]|uniref:hypothetical protein n=1 Tax=Romboutsia sedimentorum TaxID=1368474 RepID=UPI0024DE78D9|nr:hypothetical protein [Romboutsia sedimentorum]MDK2584590.1 hypothetical protein [Romboutsia sedimentorum]
MERTYDTFVDNGLFILAYYLEKEIQEISYEDIENSISIMSEKVEEYLECEKYSNLKSMVLFNSAVSNPSLKNVKLETPLKEFLNNKGSDYCAVCGKHHANINMNLKGRSYLPNKPSATYFNFSNNLHNINVCPYCLILTTYSVMNCRVNNWVYLYNSSDNEFMESFTITRQDENNQDILLKAKKLKENKNRINILMEMIEQNATFSGQVEMHMFSNGKTEDINDSEKIYSKNIKLLRTMEELSLLSEFRNLKLGWLLVGDKLEANYINYIYDSEKEELKCSRELFDFLNKEVNKMDNKTIELVDRITKNLVDAKLDISKIRKNIKGVKNIKDFDEAVMELEEIYLEKTGERLFDTYEYNELTNIRKYVKIKNMMLIDLI